jgi:pimeloyl-ACP methyl ester carboxylesterase
MLKASFPTTWTASRCQTLKVRGIRYNLRKWGDDAHPPILMLHGTQDSSITFQFVVECFRKKWCVIAPDWRGHGHSEWVRQGYWFHEFVADLDALVDMLFPERPIPIVGHSLGGNIGGVFAGLQPHRLTHLVSLDGFGPLVDRVPVDILTTLGSYLQLAKYNREHSSYATLAEVAGRLARANSRLTKERAFFLAEQSTSIAEDGRRRWLFDPSHQKSFPTLHTMPEWAAIWSAIRAPVCWISSEDTRPSSPVNVPGELEKRLNMISNVRHLRVSATGHNLHHDAPERIAEEIEEFLS